MVTAMLENRLERKLETRVEKTEVLSQSRFVIITGLSGAGKTLASRCFEDLNFFCVDNLPPALLPKFAQLCSSSDIQNAALVIDIRGRELFSQLDSALDQLQTDNVPFKVVFLDASDESLVMRFSETRRRHPLSSGGRVLEDIQQERRLLENVRKRSDLIVDTSDLTPNELKEQITQVIATSSPSGNGNPLGVTVVSFGFKYGLPMDADLVFDVRFLSNPYYVPKLRNKTGNDEEVRTYVLKQPKAQEFLERLYTMTDFLLPEYLREGKSHLTIAIGCTGGRHRSITLANELARHLQEKAFKVVTAHRDMYR
jgi:UPF0042 nucleotide-binding protein